ncbi:MAG: hypothetical protein LBD59_03735 [Prevotellaceae bacterium]|jgi:hypothetical protein|nr:hypothetical protein [Prevotellaceae bacterium]
MPQSKKEFITLLAAKMQTDETTAKLWVEAYSETLFDIFKIGEGVTLDRLGGFYLKRRYDVTIFKFNPCQKLRYYLGWTSTYKEKNNGYMILLQIWFQPII